MIIRLSSQKCRLSIPDEFRTHYCIYTYPKVQGQFLLLLRGETNAKVNVHLGYRASVKILHWNNLQVTQIHLANEELQLAGDGSVGYVYKHV